MTSSILFAGYAQHVFRRPTDGGLMHNFKLYEA